MVARVRRPKVRALKRMAALPSGVFGPVECWAFCRLGSRCLSEITYWNCLFWDWDGVPMPTFKIEYGLEGKAVSHGLWGGKWCDCFVMRGGNLLSQRVTENRPKIEGGRWSGEPILFRTVVLRQAGIHFWALERDRKRVSEGVLDAGKYRIRTGRGPWVPSFAATPTRCPHSCREKGNKFPVGAYGLR